MPYDGSEFKFEIDETTKLLIAARERIEQGWCQGAFAKDGGVCAIGALTRSYLWQPSDNPSALDEAKERLQRAVGTEGITVFNDDPATTKEAVLSKYDIAIAASLSGSAYP